MNKRLNDIKSLLKSSDYDKAAEALKSYRKEYPDDWDGKLMEGIIAQLRDDEASFRRIHVEVQAIIDKHDEQATQIKASPLWKRGHASWKKIAQTAVIGLAIAGAIAGASMMLNKDMVSRIKWAWDVICYGKPLITELPPSHINKHIFSKPEINTDVD